jgi:hypothetical protein
MHRAIEPVVFGQSREKQNNKTKTQQQQQILYRTQNPRTRDNTNNES